MVIIAHDIRSLYNVGSIFRNAAAFGVEKVFLTGITGTPPRKEIAKVALGAEELVPWEAVGIQEVIQKLRSDGYVVYGLETGEGAESIDDLSLGCSRIALVLGNEVNGLDVETRSQLDGLIEIPMQAKRSLNVASASAVAMYALRKIL